MAKKLQCVICEKIFNNYTDHTFDFKLKDGERNGTIMVNSAVKMHDSLSAIPDDHICRKCVKTIIKNGDK